jgi:hypothetical protein
VHVHTLDVIEDAGRMPRDVMRRLETQTEKPCEKTRRHAIKRVTGHVPRLYRLAAAGVEEPDGPMRPGLFPQGKEATCRELAAEAKASGPPYRLW